MSRSVMFSSHVCPAPPMTAAVCEFSIISSAPPAALTAGADVALDHCEQYWSLQSCLLQNLPLCWETPEETSPPPHWTSAAEVSVLLSESLIMSSFPPNHSRNTCSALAERRRSHVQTASCPLTPNAFPSGASRTAAQSVQPRISKKDCVTTQVLWPVLKENG